jgi:hypothetical protein
MKILKSKRNILKHLSCSRKGKISVIDGNRSEKEISDDIWKEVSKLVGSDSHHLKIAFNET